MYEILAKTENLRAVLKRKIILRKLMSVAGEFVMWANHFRRNVRKKIDGMTFDS
jgi:hypothetical protein